MDEKRCNDCGDLKPVEEFYRHPHTADGRMGQCKDCKRSYQRENYRRDPESKREYDRRRWNTPERRAYALDQQRQMREKYPEKYKARNAVSNALRDGNLHRQPCEVCGDEQSEAHHEDYSRPLDVRWLCRMHHRIEEGRYVQTEEMIGVA